MFPIVAMLGVLFTMPQYFQGVLGTTAMGSGLRLLPLVAGLVVGALPAARVVRLVGAKVAVAAGFVLLAVGLFLGSTMSVGSERPLRGDMDGGRRARDRHRHGHRHVRRAG
jgi:DHA2 family multidrug resistance protein-like MFS transporter